MRLLSFILVCFCLAFNSCTSKKPSHDLSVINPVIGDKSFLERYGKTPDRNTNDELRVYTHLKYVAQELQRRDVSHLPTVLQARRRKMISLLIQYTEAREYPSNTAYPGERRPCFIGENGNICAVGYLVEQTEGRALAEKINSLFQYSAIMEMQFPELMEWVKNSGLTLKECAMIQPAYGWDRYPTPSPEVNLATGALTGVNAAISIVNLYQFSHPPKNDLMPIFGFIGGAVQTAFGVITIEERNRLYQNRSVFNIGMGTTTMILCGFNFAKIHSRKDQNMSLDLYGFPSRDNSLNAGFRLVRKL